jgi:hypothetical protein
VPFDPEAENPAAGLGEKTAMVRHLAKQAEGLIQ